ncbi:hypothetical protein BGX21_004109 [Mortierella sp. AD011]|nr:hypothetical protein BGX20_002732 [Mortierella sp. AD010]KAF9400520.1 hypothetical protein BGX21_004109 [Mortierella sp. AD011]
MSKKLAAQALDSLLNSQSSSLSGTNGGISKKSSSGVKRSKKSKSKGDLLPKTKTGLKKIKHELRYGHSVKRAQEEKEAKENPLDKLKSQMEKEQAIVERNLEYYKTTSRVSKKELELRKKIKMLREKARGEQVRKTGVEKDESDGEDE